MARAQSAHTSDHGLDISGVELFTAGLHPLFGLYSAGPIDKVGYKSQVLPSVIEIDDLDRAVKMFFGNPPNPACSVSKNDDLSGPSHPASDRLCIDPRSESLGAFYGTDVGCAMLIAHRALMVVKLGLGKDASQLDLPSLGLAGLILSVTTSFGLTRNHRYPRPIDGDVNLGYCF